MRVCVLGLWHLGCVTAACLAKHFTTIACDPDPQTVAMLNESRAPIHEPGLNELIQEGIRAGRLSFTPDLAEAVTDADIAWIAFDTPVNEDDVADVNVIEEQVRRTFRFLRDDCLVVISSQVPVGFTGRMELLYREAGLGSGAHFAYSPENLRLGNAIEAFTHPHRIVAGIRSEVDRERLGSLLRPFCERIEWMSVESAEMTKHALNAFLAVSVAFINEVASISEQVGADAKEVERGLKSDPRIGPRAYLAPGGAFAGGTLARDVSFLTGLGSRTHVPTALLEAIQVSNQEHKSWLRRKMAELVGNLPGKVVAILGLTYKAGTNTLRRSSAVELCRWLSGCGAEARAYDPAIGDLPPELGRIIRLCHSSEEALRGAHAAVIATEWPQFQELSSHVFLEQMKSPVIIDANRFLSPEVRGNGQIVYAAVGQPRRMSA